MRCGKVGGNCWLGCAEEIKEEEERDLGEGCAVFVELLTGRVVLGAPLLSERSVICLVCAPL